jgi:hypothetical protein
MQDGNIELESQKVSELQNFLISYFLFLIPNFPTTSVGLYPESCHVKAIFLPCWARHKLNHDGYRDCARNGVERMCIIYTVRPFIFFFRAEIFLISPVFL